MLRADYSGVNLIHFWYHDVPNRPMVRIISAVGGLGVGALIQRGGRAVAGMLTIATAGGS